MQVPPACPQVGCESNSPSSDVTECWPWSWCCQCTSSPTAIVTFGGTNSLSITRTPAVARAAVVPLAVFVLVAAFVLLDGGPDDCGVAVGKGLGKGLGEATLEPTRWSTTKNASRDGSAAT